jgi:hypothetical protein
MLKSKTQTKNVGPGSAASDAAALHRREYKFLYHREFLDDLCDILSVNARAIRFGNSAVSHVQSIYFDDDHLTSCRQSLDGIDPRNKVRLRWYDNDWPSDHAIFELKHKRGNYVSKSRTSVAVGSNFKDQPFTQIKSTLTDALPPEQAAWLAAWWNPTMLVSYNRQHFLDRDTPIRMTLDYDIQGFDQTAAAKPNKHFSLPYDEVVVLEVKAPVGHEADVNRLLYPLKPRLARLSKYAQCCALMGWQGDITSEI